jgi:hypothetical protein
MIDELTSKPARSTLYHGQVRALTSAENEDVQTSTGIDLPEDLQFDPRDANVLITAGSTVRSWDAAKHLESKKSQLPASWGGGNRPQESQKSGVLPQSLLFKLAAPAKHLSLTGDGSLLMVTGGGISRIWDTSREADVARLISEPALNSISISAAASRVAAVTQDGSVRLWKLAGILNSFTSAVFRSQGSYLITHGNNLANSEIVNTKTGLVKRFPDWTRDRTYRPLSVSKDGTLIAGINYEGFDKFFVSRFENGSVGKAFWTGSQKNDRLYQTSFVFSPDNHYLVGPMENASKIWLVMWDLRGGETPVSRIPVNQDNFFEFSFDGKFIFLTGQDRGLHEFESATGKEVPVSWKGKEHIAMLAASPKGQFTAVVELHNCGDDSGGKTILAVNSIAPGTWPDALAI